MDIAQIITDRIIADLENGVAPWVKPWSASKSSPTLGMAHNPTNGTVYRGFNQFWLTMMGSSSNAWMTYKQASAVGAQVRKGEKGTPIVFWLIGDKKHTNESGQTESSKYVLLKHYTVFSVEQLDGYVVPTVPVEPTDEPTAFPEIASVESVIDRLALRGGLHHGGDSAFYTPSRDAISMPVRKAFKTDSDYCATLLHEAVHATGHKSRLDRFTPARFASEGYAYEELVAELGAAMLCARCGVDGQLQHSAYIGSWLKTLKNDKKFILTAAAHAQKAIDWIDAQKTVGATVEPIALAA